MGTRGSAVGFYRAGLIYNSGGGNRYWNGESITLATIRIGGRNVGCWISDPIRGWAAIGRWQMVRLSPRVRRATSFSLGSLDSGPASGPEAINRPAHSVVANRVSAMMVRAECFIRIGNDSTNER